MTGVQRIGVAYFSDACVVNRALVLGLLLGLSHPLFAAPCSGRGVELQVLGSGGPELTPGRAATSYLIREKGRARVLVDIGGGSAQRFGESGAKVEDLDVILLSHLHVDHSGDLPALVKSSYFQSRQRPLPVMGPPAGGAYPSTSMFVARLFGPQGAFAYLDDYLPGASSGEAADGYTLQARDIEADAKDDLLVQDWAGIKLSAIAVVHGPVPALAWRVDIGPASVAFSGDNDGNNGGLERLARDADVLVAHNAVPEGATGSARDLHMPPSVIGRISHDADVGAVVLSHRMSRTLGQERQTRLEISGRYKGPVTFANDLDCFAVDSTRRGARHASVGSAAQAPPALQ